MSAFLTGVDTAMMEPLPATGMTGEMMVARELAICTPGTVPRSARRALDQMTQLVRIKIPASEAGALAGISQVLERQTLLLLTCVENVPVSL